LIGCVVKDQVQDYPDTTLVRCIQESLELIQCAVFWGNTSIVGDIVAAID
jgi:hypothetical protein